MYFTKIEIENIKCFGKKIEFDLTNNDGTISPWTLIIGNNGLGKTTLLKSIAWMIPVPESDKKRKEEFDISNVGLKPLMDDFENNSDYEEIVRYGGSKKAKVSARLSNSKLNSSPKIDIEYSLQIVTNSEGGLEEVSPKIVDVPEFKTTNLFAYAANRHMGLKNFDNTEIQDPISNLFSSNGDLLDAEQVLANLDHASAREDEGKSTELLAKMKQVIVDLLPIIESVDKIIINPPIIDGKKNERIVEIETVDGRIPLSKLSLGYKTMFAWIVDLGLRMLWGNPDSKNPLEEPAVVVVDEIDLHLHPKWQKIIGKYLRYHFPNTQFICTAHSPIMAQSSEDDNICIIYRDNENEVKVENRPEVVQGWKIGQFVTNLFGISERSATMDEAIEERRGLIDQESLSRKEQKRLKSLDDRIAKLPIDDEQQKLLDQIKELTGKLL